MQTLIQFFKYNLVGVINTLVGFSIILFLMFLGVGPEMSNFIGYFIGAIGSYYLNKKYTFKVDVDHKITIIKFFTVLAIAYVLNFLTLHYLLGFTNVYLAQFLSAIVYTLSGFVLVKFMVFNRSS